jgi:nucleoid-associated protein YgaU
MSPDAVIVDVATWTAVAAAASLVIRARGAVAVALAVVVGGGGVAYATSGTGGSPRSPAVSVDWPTDPHRGHPTAVTVRPGDCLWDIAWRHRLHPTPRRVATDWPRWWRTNRHVIGPDPDLVLPGQRLRPPAPSWSPS